MSVQGSNYFHTDDETTLRWLQGVVTEALNQGQSLRLYTEGTRLQVKRGGGCWSPSLTSSPDPHRDV